jgi:hypothetical protein
MAPRGTMGFERERAEPDRAAAAARSSSGFRGRTSRTMLRGSSSGTSSSTSASTGCRWSLRLQRARAAACGARGWIKEGVKRKAYRQDDAWIDGVMYGLVRRI